MSSGKIVTKSEFAKICGVAKSRVSQWIREGKISGQALTGLGRSAQIDVVVATAQLRSALDTNQRFGLNGIGTKLDAESPALQPATLDEPAAPSVEDRIKAEKLRQAEMLSQRMAEEEGERRGIYVRAAEVKANFNRIAVEMVGAFEAALPSFADALAGEFGMSARAALHVLRIDFRLVRQRMSDKYAAEAAAQPDIVEETMDYGVPGS